MECVWTVDPQDSRPLKLELQQLELGPRDTITITDQPHGTGSIIKTINVVSNNKAVEVESHTGFLSLIYHMEPSGEGRGFNATYRIKDYCLPKDAGAAQLGTSSVAWEEFTRLDDHVATTSLIVQMGLMKENVPSVNLGHFTAT
ncbi:hypothetical protein M9458_016360, partial [Cirrhinus mrigala]